MKTFTIISLGCPKNTVDSRHLIESLKKEGFIYSEDFKNADFILINTCCFIEDAKEESIDEILTAAKFKFNKRLIVFGCLAQRYKKELKREIPEIDEIFGVNQSRYIIDYMKSYAHNKGNFLKHSNYTIEPKSYRYIKIADGCNRRCSFCIIPQIRGKFRSMKPEEILSEAEKFINLGIKELILVAQDITQYGKDLKGYGLKELLTDLSRIDGNFWIRLLYLYPSEIDKELLSKIEKEDKIVKYIDLPLQHSEDRILRLMGRRGSRKDYLKKIKEIREFIPGVTLRSTLIVGFPTETEYEFQRLVDFIEEVQFDRLGVFKYSREEGTNAYNLKEQIPESVKERRYKEIMERQSLISLEKNKSFVGKKYEALVDYVDADIAISRLYCHAPEIDGTVILENASDINPGDKVTVLITEAYEYDLKGVIVS